MQNHLLLKSKENFICIYKLHDGPDEMIAVFNGIRSKLISDDDDKNKDRKLEIIQQIIEVIKGKYSELSKKYLLDYKPLESWID